MRENFAASLKQTLYYEGGFSNHPDDAGGATQCGIIQTVYDGYRRRKGLIPRSVRYLTDDERDGIYRQLYWDKVDGDALPVGVDFCVFDAAVNSGPSRGARWLQQAVNDVAGHARLTVDGNIGPATLDASDDYAAVALIEAMVDRRLGFMKIAKNTRTGKALWPVFGKGWGNRMLGYYDARTGKRADDGVLQVARRMASASAADAPRKIGLPVPVLAPAPVSGSPPAPAVAFFAVVVAIIVGVAKWIL